MGLFDFFNKNKTNKKLNGKERKTVNTEFAKGINLEQSFEDMFPDEIPEEVKAYDLNGNEVEL